MDSSKDTTATRPEVLSPDEVRLLVHAACCVIAADGKLAQKEMDALLAALDRLGLRHDPQTTRTHVMAACKQLHRKGVESCATEIAQRVAGASSCLKTALTSLTTALEVRRAAGTATAAEIVVGTVLQSAVTSSIGGGVAENPDGFELGSDADEVTRSASSVRQQAGATPAVSFGRRDEWLWWWVAGVPLVGGVLVGLLSVFDWRAALQATHPAPRPLVAPAREESVEQVMLAELREQNRLLKERLDQQSDARRHADEVNAAEAERKTKSLEDDVIRAKADALKAQEEVARLKAAAEASKRVVKAEAQKSPAAPSPSSVQQRQRSQPAGAADDEAQGSLKAAAPEMRTFQFGVSKWVRNSEYLSFTETIQARDVNEARDICIGRHSTPDARGEMPSIFLMSP